MSPSWNDVRADFPILHQQVNGKPLVYLDNGATAQKPKAVIDALVRYYERDNSNVHRGLHALSMRATDAYEGARSRLARFIHAADPAEVIFTRGTTESINLVARSLGAKLKAGDVILATEMEHHSNLVPWQQAAKASGATLRFVPVVGANAEGGLDLAALDQLLTPQVKVFAFTHISNTLGTINPVAELCRRARAVGALSVVDAAQSVGHTPLDVQALGCDYLDALGRDAIKRHDHALARRAYAELATLPGIRLLGPTGERGGLVSFAFEHVHAHDVVTFADEDGVALRGGHHCNQPLMRKLGLTSTTRASFYLYNTPEEIDVLIASLRRTLKFFQA